MPDTHADAPLGKMDNLVGMVSLERVPRSRGQPLSFWWLNDPEKFDWPIQQVVGVNKRHSQALLRLDAVPRVVTLQEALGKR